jgi:hypothetical protein
MSIAAIGTISSLYQPQAAAGGTTTGYIGADAATPATSSLTAISSAGLPTVRLTADQLAAVQEGSKPPDPAKAQAEANTPAYALIKDAQTGKVLGGVWPGVASIAASGSASDSRLAGASAAEQAHYLAQDITQATGAGVTIQYFQPSDPAAPTFGSDVIGTYWN